MRWRLAVLGVFLMIGMFYYANVYLSATEKLQIGSAASVCNSITSSLFQIFNGRLVTNCIRLTLENDILALRPYVYIIGFGMFALGSVTGNRRPVAPFYTSMGFNNARTGPALPLQQASNVLTICPVCMSRSPEESKFCAECGTDIKPRLQVTLRS